MKRILAVLFLVMGLSGYSQESNLSDASVERIKSLITLFENEDREGIAKRIVYPLKREYPLPPVTSEFEFVSRFEEFFVPEFSAKIANSVIEEYSHMGWRGIMFDLGRMWLTESGDIYRIIDQTELEKKIREEMIQADKKRLHRSVNKFLEPYAIIKTGQDIWRIDRKDEKVMRLTIWNDGKLVSDVPDLILEGTEDIQGTMGNRVLYFKDKKANNMITILMDNPESEVAHEVTIITIDSEGNEVSLKGQSDN
ncbi:hypothetical protein [Myroides sp. C4067]|uniref:hypothetical protein n=1 Tax=Myroides sp. C4067 TaxID=3136765 RepID=UPI00310166AB